MSFIKVENYSKLLKKRKVLDKINISIERGSVIGLYGRNASGKTMLLRAMAGLIMPTEGSVSINDVPLRGKHRFPESCGLLIETINFWPGLTAKATLEVLCSINKKANASDIHLALERVGLDPKDKRTVKKFSLGMKQKLAIAQSIVEKPDILLLDEPTNSLDEIARKDFANIIDEEKARGCTIIMASHILEDLDLSCDKILRIENGQLSE